MIINIFNKANTPKTSERKKKLKTERKKKKREK